MAMWLDVHTYMWGHEHDQLIALMICLLISQWLGQSTA